MWSKEWTINGHGRQLWPEREVVEDCAITGSPPQQDCFKVFALVFNDGYRDRRW